VSNDYEKLIERTKSTRFQPGKTGNAGGFHKTKRELRVRAREGLDLAIERAIQILKDENAEPRSWMEAGKFLGPYGYGLPPKAEKEDDATGSERSHMSIEERRAIARMKLSTEKAPDAVPGDDSDSVN